MAESEIDDERIAAVCQVLHEHEVAFVIIGGAFLVLIGLLPTGRSRPA